MSAKPQTGIAGHFKRVKDPRCHRVDHLLVEIITIAICTVICGADSWVEVEAFRKAKKEWLQTLLVLPHGISSYDTFGRIFGQVVYLA